jgi:hypothetical protein
MDKIADPGWLRVANLSRQCSGTEPISDTTFDNLTILVISFVPVNPDEYNIKTGIR